VEALATRRALGMHICTSTATSSSNAAQGFENLGQGLPATLGLTQIVVTLKIQGQGAQLTREHEKGVPLPEPENESPVPSSSGKQKSVSCSSITVGSGSHIDICRTIGQLRSVCADRVGTPCGLTCGEFIDSRCLQVTHVTGWKSG
jgi:hypothetical protein